MLMATEPQKAGKPKRTSIMSNPEVTRLVRVLAGDEGVSIPTILDKYALPGLRKAYRRILERDKGK